MSHQTNLQIEKLVAQKGDSRAAYTPAELALLERYTGAGGLAKQGATGKGLLSEFYTPDAVAEMMWRLAIDHGAVWFRPERPCRILEPAVGTGAFIRHFYREHIHQVTRGSIQIRAFETSPVSAKIARVLVDDPARFTVWEESFERAFIENNSSVGGRINRVFAEWRDFDLVIGNPPYGVYKSYTGGLGEKAHTKARQWEHYFIQRGLDVLKPGGYLIMVVPSGFVRSQYDYSESKKYIAERAMLMDSFRLPNGVFAATEVGTDILVFRRNDFTPSRDTLEAVTDLLTGDSTFRINPETVLGTPTESGCGQFGKEPCVKGTLAGAVERFNAVSVGARYYPEKQTKTPPALKPAPGNKEEILARARARMPELDSLVNQRIAGFFGLGSTADGTPHELTSFGEAVRSLNPALSEEEIQAWVWFHDDIQKPLEGGWRRFADAYKTDKEGFAKRMAEKGILCAEPRGGALRLVPACIYYGGNIYDKLAELRQVMPEIMAAYGSGVYERQHKGLAALLPTPLNLTDPSPDNRLKISAVSLFAAEFSYLHTEETDGEGPAAEPVRKTLAEGFREWLRTLAADQFQEGLTQYHVVSFYLEGNAARGTSKEEREKVKEAAKREGERLFAEFLHQLEPVVREGVERTWNRQYNAIVTPDYAKFPVAFRMNKYFKKGKANVRPAQREGVAFLQQNGAGIVAYDVGVGKTMTAILAVAQAMDSGQAKRPLIVVPNAVYHKWILEIAGGIDEKGQAVHGVLPHFPINALHNLNEAYLKPLTGKNGGFNKVPEMSITIMSYEGMARLGLTQDGMDTLGAKMKRILSQGAANAKADAKMDALIEEQFGMANKGTYAPMEAFGFDYFVMDEAHNAKNIFSRVKSDKTTASHFQIQGGEPSARALKAFMLSQHVMAKTGGRNVALLTATPFTNSPLEIYSMLSLVGYDRLEEFGIANLQRFFETFVNEQTELAVTAKGDFDYKPVIKGFLNRQILQNLVYAFINYKTGEEANIQRPEKIVLPRANRLAEDGRLVRLPSGERVSTTLKATPLQAAHLKSISEYAAANRELNELCDTDENLNGTGKEDPGRMLRALSMARAAALSPFLYRCVGPPPDYKTFVDESPKFKYAVECIRSVKKWHEKHGEPVSGQVIYANAGKEYFGLVKQYLIKELGYKPHEVEIYTSEVANAKREQIKTDFLANKVKVVIGTNSIKEGVDLQNHGSVLYNLWVDWNPTDARQLEGRIWRFGNKFGKVRVVVPLIENSVDIFLFQKLEEKTSRINDIWYRAGRENVLKLDELNPEELKYALITDTGKLAKLRVEEEARETEVGVKILQTKQQAIFDYAREAFGLNRQVNEAYIPFAKRAGLPVDNDIAQLLRRVAAKIAELEKRQDWDALRKLDGYTLKHQLPADRLILARLNRTWAAHLSPQGIPRMDPKSAADYAKGLTAMVEEMQRKVTEIKSPASLERIKAEIEAERIRLSVESKPLEHRVGEFAALNDATLASRMDYATKPEPAPGKPALSDKEKLLIRMRMRQRRIEIEVLVRKAA